MRAEDNATIALTYSVHGDEERAPTASLAPVDEAPDRIRPHEAASWVGSLLVGDGQSVLMPSAGVENLATGSASANYVLQLARPNLQNEFLETDYELGASQKALLA